MKRKLLLWYQVAIGLSDTSTGLLLIFAPALTLHSMHLTVAPAALPFLSYVGVFVLSVGVACSYGAYLATASMFVEKLEVVWVLTGLTRALVAIFVVARIHSGALESGWMTVAITDGAIALLQAFGLWKGWLADGAA